MTKTSTIGQILSDAEVGLLPYMRQQLEAQEFAKFQTQFSFRAEESKTQLKEDSSFTGMQTTLSVSLKFLMILHSQISSDEAILLALELQEILEATLVQWGQHAPQLLAPIAEITGSFSNLEEVRYQGGYLPGFSLELKFALSYNPEAAVRNAGTPLSPSTRKLQPDLYSPGERAPESGQYAVIDVDGANTGVEVTSTQGNPLPPTPEPNQFYQLVDPTKHKQAKK